MKRSIKLLPITIFLFLLFPLRAFADVIFEEPETTIVEAISSGPSIVPIVIVLLLVAGIVTGTVLIIRKLLK